MNDSDATATQARTAALSAEQLAYLRERLGDADHDVGPIFAALVSTLLDEHAQVTAERDAWASVWAKAFNGSPSFGPQSAAELVELLKQRERVDEEHHAHRDALLAEARREVEAHSEFNINHEVWVRLTEHGVQAYQRYYNVGGNGPHAGREMVARRTVNGWTREQLWVLMAVLGPRMHMGGPALLEMMSIRFTDPNAPAGGEKS